MNKLHDTPLAMEPGDNNAGALHAGDAALPPDLEARRDQMFPTLFERNGRRMEMQTLNDAQGNIPGSI